MNQLVCAELIKNVYPAYGGVGGGLIWGPAAHCCPGAPSQVSVALAKCIFEDLAVKRCLFSSLEDDCRHRTTLASV